ncbi:MAG: amino acid racemase [Proteobacteria bacterium]|nr:amino acid racemase [Pseudomonadota bacterium]
MSKQSKIVGVLGGMGPDATVDFMAKVIALTPAEKDQDHIHMIVDQNPKVPNRQDAILADGEDPGPVMAEMAQRLETAGADFLVVPCNSAFGFAGAVAGAVSIPLVSIVDVTVEACDGISTVGLLATDGCLQSHVYQDAFSAAGITAELPDKDELADLMALLNSIKAGYRGESIARDMGALAAALVARGAQAIIAGCTEIPLVLDDHALDVPLISSTDVLAARTVAIARGETPLPVQD